MKIDFEAFQWLAATAAFFVIALLNMQAAKKTLYVRKAQLHTILAVCMLIMMAICGGKFVTQQMLQ